MSSQKGNVAHPRPQLPQNTCSFKNDKFAKSVQTKKINAKLHGGICQCHKEVLDRCAKHSKYKVLSKPKKYGTCLEKSAKDSYHITCGLRGCAFEVCAKCRKKGDIVALLHKQPERTENTESIRSNHRCCRRNEQGDDDLHFDLDDTKTIRRIIY
ncbi:LOW QUALITY PROTEIN: uncharacterized protein C9orf85 homolog [Lynx canadensis]|nr:LOW QUALITY PROTEIN: uncharacterized protein C9orf85 homolog [Lynx canadensis]